MDPNDPNQQIIITTKPEMEAAIIKRNQQHARQSLNTPFASIPELSSAINPENPTNQIEEILQGEFISKCGYVATMSTIEKQWIQELSRRLSESIDTHITVQDFITFFKKRKEKTASSYSGHHLGHYKAIAELAVAGQPEIAQTLVNIINISLLTS